MRPVSRITGVSINTVTKLLTDAGDAWTWTAIDAESKLVISWHVRPRDLGSANAFMMDLVGWL